MCCSTQCIFSNQLIYLCFLLDERGRKFGQLFACVCWDRCLVSASCFLLLPLMQAAASIPSANAIPGVHIVVNHLADELMKS